MCLLIYFYLKLIQSSRQDPAKYSDQKDPATYSYRMDPATYSGWMDPASYSGRNDIFGPDESGNIFGPDRSSNILRPYGHGNIFGLDRSCNIQYLDRMNPATLDQKDLATYSDRTDLAIYIRTGWIRHHIWTGRIRISNTDVYCITVFDYIFFWNSSLLYEHY